MKQSTHITIKYLLGFLFVLLMIAIATIFNDKETILPEIAALTTGLWIYQEANWLQKPVKIFFIPSITAIVGFAINKSPLTYSQKVLLLLLLMILLLRTAKSVLAPSFATGLLPIIVNATHYSFIIAILAFTFILMAIVMLRKLDQKNPTNLDINYPVMLIFLIFSFIWVIAVSLLGHPQMAAIPPVLVVFFEVLQKPNYSGKMAFKHIVSLSGAASIGVITHLLISSWMLTTIISLPLVFILLTIIKVKVPAAYAFPLLALVLPTPMFHMLPLSSLISTVFFFGGAYAYNKLARAKLVNLKEQFNN